MTSDHLGSPRVITGKTGQVIARKDFNAFGDETFTSQRTEALGYKPENIRQDYTGYQKDDESGLEFAQARYYNTGHGRFTSIDPLIASANTIDPQTFNRYSYAMNSPYKFTDPLGLISENTGACGSRCRGVDHNGPVVDDDVRGDYRPKYQYVKASPQPTQQTGTSGSQAEGQTTAQPQQVQPPPVPVTPLELAPVAFDSADDLAAQAARQQLVTAAEQSGSVALRSAVFTGALVVVGAVAMILTLNTTAQAPSPRREDRGGYAIVNNYPKGSTINGVALTHRHVTITVVANNGLTMTTGQISVDNSTTIDDAGDYDAAPMSLKIPLPDAQSAIAYQMSSIGMIGAPYDPVNNSCVLHVANVLRAGGVPIPAGSTSLQIFREINKFKPK